MTTAAVLGLRGLPAARFLTTRDPEELVLLTAVAQRSVELHKIEQQNLAALVVNELGKAMRRG